MTCSLLLRQRCHHRRSLRTWGHPKTVTLCFTMSFETHHLSDFAHKKRPQTIAYLKKTQCQSLNTLQPCATSAKPPQTTGTADQTAVDTCSLVASAISLEKLSQEVAKVKKRPQTVAYL